MKRINMLLRLLRQEFETLSPITVESYSPGDGWTRYSIHTKGGYRLASSLKRNECEMILTGMLEVLRYNAGYIK